VVVVHNLWGSTDSTQEQHNLFTPVHGIDIWIAPLIPVMMSIKSATIVQPVTAPAAAAATVAAHKDGLSQIATVWVWVCSPHTVQHVESLPTAEKPVRPDTKPYQLPAEARICAHS
jgi:hypothetical protein